MEKLSVSNIKEWDDKNIGKLTVSNFLGMRWQQYLETKSFTFQESYSNMKTKEEEMQEMATEIQQLQQETTNQKVENIQLTSEKGELEQHLEVLPA